MAKIGTINDDFVDDLIGLVAKHWPNKPGQVDGDPQAQLDIVASLQAPLDVVVTGVYGIEGSDLVTGFFKELEDLDQVEDFHAVKHMKPATEQHITDCLRAKFVELGMGDEATDSQVADVLAGFAELEPAQYLKDGFPPQTVIDHTIEVAIFHLLKDDSPIKQALGQKIAAAQKPVTHGWVVADFSASFNRALHPEGLSLAEMQEVVTKATDGKMALTVGA